MQSEKLIVYRGDKLDSKYLNYILTIAKKKNMTRAAEELYVSQSSLSQYLTKLEQEIGNPLFFRTKGELTLTPAGKLYVEAAEKVIEIQKQLYKDISGLENRGEIKVGVTSQFGLRMLSEIIPPYKQEYPFVSIEISETSLPALTDSLLHGSLDLGIMAANTLAPFESQCVVLKEEEVFFAIPVKHPYCKENKSRPIPIEQLMPVFEKDNFLLSKKGSTLRVLADQIFEKCNFWPRTMCETNSIIATRTMVGRGVGVTFIAESCANERQTVSYYSLEPKLYRYNLLVHRKHWNRNKAEMRFCEYIKKHSYSSSTAHLS